MGNVIAIHKLSEQLGLTSRTLRHWEAEGLFASGRDQASGWRIYDEHAVLCIRMTSALRALDIPLKEIKSVIDDRSHLQLIRVVNNHLAGLKEKRTDIQLQEEQLKQVLVYLQEQGRKWTTNPQEVLLEMEEILMKETVESKQLKFINLPPMRVAYHIAVSESPEDEAMTPVVNWIKETGLLGTARLFGGNVKPWPKGKGTPYGYGMCATIPEGVAVPAPLQEMVLPGGLFAMLESSEDIEGSWKVLMASLAKHDKYVSDRSRLCLEEHIRNDKPEGNGNDYFLSLLEPVKLK